MRVALLPSAFAPRVGGVEIFTDRLARSLQDHGHEIEIWTSRTRGDTLAEDEVMSGLRVRRFAFDAPRARLGAAVRWPARAVTTLRKMRAALHEFDPDVLHVHCFSGNGVYATLLALSSQTPLVVTLHGETFMDDHDIYRRSLYLRSGLRAGLWRARCVTACSRYTLDDAIAHFGADPTRSRVIFNGADPTERELSNWQAPAPRFIFGLGRVVHRKGFDLLVQAWARIAADHSDTMLVIGGAGPELPRLRGLVGELSLEDRVQFCGPMSRADVREAMRTSDVFVLPSRVEAFGIVVLEAWRAGTPVVATSNGGPPEFVEHDISGLIVDPTNVDALAESVDRVLTDDELRQRLSKAGFARVADFGWPRIREQYEAVYKDALGSA